MSQVDEAELNQFLLDDAESISRDYRANLGVTAPRGSAIEQYLQESHDYEQAFYPLNAPGMPVPGPGMVQLARDLGGEVVITGKGKNARLESYDEKLEGIYRSMLYSAGSVHIPISIDTHRKKRLSVVTGSQWLVGDKPGPSRADVMVISKMLGEEEKHSGRNFVGDSGRLLEELCEKLRIPGYEQWYITNVLKTVHPQAEFGNTTLKQTWISEFLPLLHQEIRLVRPKFILLAGADALKALLGKKATLKSMLGRVVEYRYPINREEPKLPTEQPQILATARRRLKLPPTAVSDANDPTLPAARLTEYTALVMACTHPAAVLRTPELEEPLEMELSRFGQLVRGFRPDQPEDDIDHRELDSLAELLALEQEIKRDCQKNRISIDAEWHGEHPQNDGAYLRTIQLCWKLKTAVCIHICHPGGKWRFKGEQKELAACLKRICKGRRIVGQFLAADFEWLIPFGLDLREEFGVAASWEETMEQALDPKTPQGGFDVGLALHALDETADFSLTSQTLRFTAAPRYDSELVQWRDKYCNENKLKKEQLEGYGLCPDEILVPYSIYDCDIPWRLVDTYQQILCVDRFENNCWQAFWTSMRAQPAVMEMQMTGISIDRERMDRLSDAYITAKENLAKQLRDFAKWPELNLESVFHVREFLFGEELNGKQRDNPHVPVRIRPKGAKSLYLRPVITTDKRPMKWERVIEQGLEAQKSPSTNKTSLAILWQDNEKVQRFNKKLNKTVTYNLGEPVKWLRDYRFVSQVMKSILRVPEKDEDENYLITTDGDGEGDYYVYPGGLPKAICKDGRVRTRIWPTKETGRWSTTAPPTQNFAKRREADYARILGSLYRWPLRSIIRATPGYVLIDVDYLGAELLGMAIMANDKTMIDHAQRNSLPEDHPNFYDIHSNTTVMAFRLDCPPTKSGLKSIGKSHLRVVAKSVAFGIGYGRGAKAIALALREEGVSVTEEETQVIVDSLFRMYPGLVPFFEACSRRALQERWMCGVFGRFRRFGAARDEKIEGDLERQGMNFPIQNMVADAINRAVDHLCCYRKEHTLIDYRMLLQVHDALLLEVPNAFVEDVATDVLPECMCNKVPIYPTDLNGVPNGTGPYYLGIDVEPCLAWGELMLPNEYLSRQIKPELGGWRFTNDGWRHSSESKKVWVGDAKGGVWEPFAS